jgi:Domain of unknown function (DUF4382)
LLTLKFLLLVCYLIPIRILLFTLTFLGTVFVLNIKKIMKAKSILAAFVIALLSAVLVFTSCQKDILGTDNIVPQGKQKVMVYLNDDPENYYKVLVDLQMVEVKVDTGSSYHDDHHYDGDDDGDDDHNSHDSYGQWDTLSITPGIYDLLRLRNGVDTLFAGGNTWAGRITKIRVKLGANNTLWTDSTHNYPLFICDSKPYVYIKIKEGSIDTLPSGFIRIKLDFNVSKSIKKKNGSYCLKPEIKAWSEKNTGSVEGKVYPREAMTRVSVYNANDTAFAFPEHDGEFKIKGLKEGNYSVLYDGIAPYIDTTISNIQIYKGRETKLPSVTLRR